MGKALYIESVENAAALAGGYERLAAELGVSSDEVQSWRAGASIPENTLFLRLIDLLFSAAAPNEGFRPSRSSQTES